MPPDTTDQIEPKILPLPAGSPLSPGHGWKSFRGLLWCEWFVHSKLLVLFLAAWLACVWILPLYVNPACILILGAAFAIIAGPVFGGGDTTEGCEEFTLALPPTRAERYLARLAVGGGALLLLSIIDVLALGLDLPQVLGKLYVRTGLIQPWPVLRSGLLYGLVLVLPASVFSFSFAISAITRSRAVLLSASLWSVLLSLAALRVCFWYEATVWDNLNGWFSCPVLTILSLAALRGGYAAYRRKEIGPHAEPIAIPAHWWFWIILFVLGLFMVITLASSIAIRYPHLFH